MCVKVLVVIAKARVHGEVRSGFTPSSVRCDLFSIRYPTSDYLRWDVGAISRPEPELNAGISRFRYNVISATIEVKCRAVGGATSREDDTTPFVGVGERVAVVAGGGSVRSNFEKENSVSVRANRKGSYPVCGRALLLGGIVHPGVVCKLAWFCVLKLMPAWQ